MYKYTLLPELFYVDKSKPEWWNTKFQKQMEFVKAIGAGQKDVFSVLCAVEKFSAYVSKKPLTMVPVNGWLIPVKYFNVSEV